MSDLTSKEIIALLDFSERHWGPSGIYVHDEESEYLAIGPRIAADVLVTEGSALAAQHLAHSIPRAHVEFDPYRNDPWVGTSAPAFIFLAAG